MSTAPDAARERPRATFDGVADLYDRARPRYPEQLFTDLAESAGLTPGSRVLEIGCGTGQATVPLARRGYAVTAVELGAGMAAVARRNLARWPDAEVTVSAFEDWTLPAEPFDAVVSATAFAWVDPTVRVRKAAAALRPGGVLATVATHHVAGGDDEFFRASQEFYERFIPSTPKDLRLTPADSVPRDSAEIDASGLFGPAAFRRYPCDISYTTAQYLDVLNTYSNHLDLVPEVRADLLASLAGLIDGRHGGRITKRYLFELRTAHRLG
ncbi:class I SAM-dependent DNA methyltransferase [Streptomyces avicenniae]|uniref:class I SAM-dependent DNA methyltransferase n=1 Tax=Streptomyces avicenniae TaxID=500153 RepID=UPI00069BB092|nr:class I SAM-dependent methyltransferase [Streptomyces avicenniae]